MFSQRKNKLARHDPQKTCHKSQLAGWGVGLHGTPRQPGLCTSPMACFSTSVQKRLGAESSQITLSNLCFLQGENRGREGKCLALETKLGKNVTGTDIYI